MCLVLKRKSGGSRERRRRSAGRGRAGPLPPRGQRRRHATGRGAASAGMCGLAGGFGAGGGGGAAHLSAGGGAAAGTPSRAPRPSRPPRPFPPALRRRSAPLRARARPPSRRLASLAPSQPGRAASSSPEAAGAAVSRAAAAAHLGARSRPRAFPHLLPERPPGEPRPPPRRARPLASSGPRAGRGGGGRRAEPAGPVGNMATGGYRAGSGGGGSTTDFLEEWKAKREKMRAKQNPAGAAAPGGGGGGGDAAGKPPAGALGTSAAAAANELNNNLAGGAAAPAGSGPGGVNCAGGPAALTRVGPGPRRPEDEPPSAAAAAAAGAPPARGDPEERDGAPDKGKSSGPSARKGKGQIEKRKLREKRRSTGVVNIPAAECLDEYEDDEAGQKERKREDAITQQNTMQNEAVSLLEPGSSYLLQEPSRTVSGRYKSTTTASEEDVSSRYPRTDRSGFSRYNRDANASGNLLSSSTLEKKIEDLEKEVVRERQENLRLVRLMQDKEEMIGKLKEEIDLLNRDLDDIEDENEQLKQENKTLLKVVGQLTR
uniref:Pro-apoptotic WT1 regulator n=3 Tax=Equus caballus TaxID=9796 RepID=F6UHS4_HORSE